ncbi:MAG: polysaccharide pyruvyl transferase family protein, partial [Candidatus Riflebacteria bacterium]|nr:polysaccharide pyruvyl transferase family protein [Candidatus Riflebacteria bacterium]
SSDIVLTDSFHGTVFSILFEKPFIVFDRIHEGPSMVTRVETLLSKFKLESRKWQNMKNKNMNDLFEIDFSHVPSILEAERKKALDFLKTALDVEQLAARETEIGD